MEFFPEYDDKYSQSLMNRQNSEEMSLMPTYE